MTTLSENKIARLTIDIPVDFHRVIKANATLASNSIKEYVVDAIKKKLIVEGDCQMQKKLNKKTANLLQEYQKAEKVVFDDVNSAMGYLTDKS